MSPCASPDADVDPPSELNSDGAPVHRRPRPSRNPESAPLPKGPRRGAGAGGFASASGGAARCRRPRSSAPSDGAAAGAGGGAACASRRQSSLGQDLRRFRSRLPTGARAWSRSHEFSTTSRSESRAPGSRWRHLGGNGVIQRRFNVSVPRARAPKKSIRDRSEG